MTHTLIGLDVDGTLTAPFSTAIYPVTLRRVRELRALPATRLAVLTNQAAPLCRHVSGEAHYNDVDEVARKLTAIAYACDLHQLLWLVSIGTSEEWDRQHRAPTAAEGALVETALHARLSRYLPDAIVRVVAHASWRKPATGMLVAAPAIMNDTTYDQLIYIGDRDTDREAARAAGWQFVDATIWREQGVR